MPKKGFIPNKLRPWIEARTKFHLSHAQVQMARELGLNPKKFGSMANHKQEQWKVPLPNYIEHLYEKRFNAAPQDIAKKQLGGRRDGGSSCGIQPAGSRIEASRLSATVCTFFDLKNQIMLTNA